MAFQFIRIETFARSKTSHKNSKKNFGIKEILEEAERKLGACPHVPNPLPPTKLYGSMELNEIEEYCENWADGKVDSKGRKLRSDTPLLIAGVLSLPDELMAQWKLFRFEAIEFLKDEYGSNLINVVEHLDEAHPHLHFYVVPDAHKTVKDLHQGLKAGKGYRKAMIDFQNKFYEKVALKFGLLRTGPGRERLSTTEYKKSKDRAKKLAAIAKATIDNFEQSKRALAAAKEFERKNIEKSKTLDDQLNDNIIVKMYKGLNKATIESAVKVAVDERDRLHQITINQKNKDTQVLIEKINSKEKTVKELKQSVDNLTKELAKHKPISSTPTVGKGTTYKVDDPTAPK